VNNADCCPLLEEPHTKASICPEDWGSLSAENPDAKSVEGKGREMERVPFPLSTQQGGVGAS